MEIKQKHFLSLVFGGIYILSSAGETLAVKALNYAAVPLILPTYTAFLSNQMWFLMIPLYFNLKQTNTSIKHTLTHYGPQYLGMGILTFAITLLRNISVNSIPGSIFTLLISTSIIFNMLLSYLFLKKSFNMWHLAAALACVSSAISIGITVFITPDETTAQTDFTLGISTALGAAFVIAMMSVWQEYLQTGWDDYKYRVVEMSFVASILASILIVLYSFITQELETWQPAISASARSDLILVVCLSVALPVLKLLVRNSKYETIQQSNAFFFEFVQASGSLFGSIASILIFNEPWRTGYLIAFVLLFLSFGFYIKARLESKRKTSEKTLSVASDIEVVTHSPIHNVGAWK
jgi:drug/metabolite transporter (DMT)-like permease